jgi:putative transposase
MMIATWPKDAPRGAVSQFCGRYGISRSQFYAIRAAAARDGSVAAALGPRPRSRPDLATAPAVVAAALRIRKELAEDGWDHGPLSVRAVLLDAGLPAPSRATLARIFTREGAVVPQPHKRPRSSWRRFTFAHVHECWQLDGTEWALADGTKAVIFQLLDDHSRYIVGSLAAPAENGDAAIALMQAAVAAHQAPGLLLTDNAVALNPHRRGKTSRLAAYARSIGTQPITSRIYHPQTCGKNERVHQTLQRWLQVRPRAATLAELTAQLHQFDDHYNHRRRHQALNMRTPADVLASDPRAVPPTSPPPSTPPSHPPTPAPTSPIRHRRSPGRAHPRDRLRVLTVMRNGSVKAAGYYIGLGVDHAGSHVLALLEPPDQPTIITIFDSSGSELRTIHPTPDIRYYRTGRPKGGRRRTRLDARLTTTTTSVQPN